MEQSVQPTVPRWKLSLSAALLPAVLATLLNAAKPIHLDDTCFHLFAAHIAEHPADPFGFQIFWDQAPQSAAEVLAPPVVPAWLAIGIRLFGQHPVAWKLWFFPFVLLFAASFHALLLRFARGLQTPLLWMTLFSPAFLPGMNLMLDVPALGLALFSIVLFLHAMEQESFRWAILAGIIAGIASETKYTALTAPVLMATISVLRRRMLPGFVAAAIAFAMFGLWEGMTWIRYGTCHLVHTMFHYPYTWRKADLVLPFFTYLGGLAPALLLVALCARRLRPIFPTLVGTALLLVFPGLGLLPSGWSRSIDDRGLDAFGIPLTTALLLLVGAAVAAFSVSTAWRLGARRWKLPFSRLPDRLLAVWLLMEIPGYFVLSPYPAARRFMPLLLVMTLILGRFAALRIPAVSFKRRLIPIVAFSMLLGGAYFLVDYREANAQKDGALEASTWIRSQDPSARIWYAGHWGFQYYAERENMQPLVPNRSPVRAGDWVVLPDVGIAQQKCAVFRSEARTEKLLELDDRVPFRTLPSYYSGSVPIERRQGCRFSVRILRATTDFVVRGG